MKNNYRCKECSNETIKWYGKCDKCGRYNTLIEINDKLKVVETLNLSEISLDKSIRIKTYIKQMDKILGGGFVVGSLNLIAGSPGVGKSTLLLQCINQMDNDIKVLYVSSEENLSQIKLRAVRINFIKDTLFANICEVETIMQTAKKENVKFLIVDSVQTTISNSNSNPAQSVSQLKTVTIKLMEFSKDTGIVVVLVGHITKDGEIAGPKLLEHMVDVVIQISNNENNLKVIKCLKNRFGSIDEVGYFQMENKGLVEFDVEFDKISIRESEGHIGLSISLIREGQNLLFVETQGLTIKTSFGSPKRSGHGIEINRLLLLVAILMSKTEVDLSCLDVYVKLFGGIKSKDTNTDLALLVALYSASKNLKIPRNFLFIGEVNLTGEVNTRGNVLQIIEYAKRHGFQKIFLNTKKECNDEEVIICKTINEVISKVWRN